MTTTLSRRLLLAFAVLGLGSATYSLYIHYQLTHQPGYLSACDINALFSCSNAYLSRYGAVAGIPVALFGALWFAFVALLLIAAGRPGSPLADSVGSYVFALATLALAGVLYLGYAAFFILKAVCIFCLITYVAVIGLFVLSGLSTTTPMLKLPRRAIQDLRALTSRPGVFSVLVLFVAAAAASLALFPRVTVGATGLPERPAPTRSQQNDFITWFDAQPRLTLPVSPDGAKVLIVKFTDFQCPHCTAAHLAERPLLSRLQSEFPGLIRMVTKHYPLEKECNPMSGDSHIAACEAAAALIMARSRGREEVLADWFAKNQLMLSPAVVKEAARTTGLVADFEAQYPRALEEVKTDVGLGRLLGVRQTPTYFLNGVKLEGALPPPLFETAIRHELAKAGVRK